MISNTSLLFDFVDSIRETPRYESWQLESQGRVLEINHRAKVTLSEQKEPKGATLGNDSQICLSVVLTDNPYQSLPKTGLVNLV